MSNPITIIPQPLAPTRTQNPARNGQPGSIKAPGSFDQLLQNKIEQGGVKFSKHATDRMQSRGINFNPNQIQRLESAVSQVSAKGGQESLVILDNTALVVSIKNDTVVTVVDQNQLKNNVFTNIDSAVIA
ncbi:TIGR02530 family flagellar biosynthesis protein [uncultured Desulfuromusa sp.]|uniref:TIGR02530 family flagellar biosynthesis protein n=1 Tax=uncultured Desulfuromusa sp. TaxID=219183 RepID=UPI002AA90645|nr:TIGR02530 family flagellar biosynthesis protein [uncultured Desulfuromusa sp.]